MSQERIDMLKEMIEQSVNPAGWIGYYEGKIATFLFKQEDVPRFLENTDPVGSVVPLYTHPAKELNEAIKIIKDFQSDDVPPCKAYEDTYADGWMDACNEILWAIEEQAQEK